MISSPQEVPIPDPVGPSQDHLEQAYVFRGKARYRDALRECDLAIQQSPDRAEAHNLCGILLEESGQTEAAVLAYREALRLDPAFLDAQQNLREVETESKGSRPKPSASAQPGVVCADCGHLNRSGRLTCQNCNATLERLAGTTGSASERRPGCVSAFTIFLVMSAGLNGLVAAVLGFGLPLRSGAAGLALFAVAAGFVAFQLLLARGLWKLKNWARLTVMVLYGLAVVLNALVLCTILGNTTYDFSGLGVDLTVATFWLVGTALGAFVVYWFGSHGRYFS